jgi:hypothetical protein
MASSKDAVRHAGEVDDDRLARLQRRHDDSLENMLHRLECWDENVHPVCVINASRTLLLFCHLYLDCDCAWAGENICTLVTFHLHSPACALLAINHYC